MMNEKNQNKCLRFPNILYSLHGIGGFGAFPRRTFSSVYALMYCEGGNGKAET